LTGAALGKPFRAEFHHQVAYGEPFADILLGIELTARVQGNAPLGDNSGCQGNVGGYNQVFRCGMFGNIVIGNIEALGDDNGFDQFGVMFAQALV